MDGLIRLVLLVGVFLPSAFGQVPVPDNPDMPPAKLWHPEAVFSYQVNASPRITARVTINTSEQRVDVLYSHKIGSWQYLRSEVQEYTTGFWPTDAAYVNASTLVVVGKSLNTGKTIVQAWVFSPPSLGTDGGGNTIVEPGTRTPPTTIFEALTTGKKLVRTVSAHHGTTDPSVLIQFDDSRDLYSLNLRTGDFTLLASQLSGSGAMTVGALSKPWTEITTRKFANGGYFYSMSRKSDLVEGTTDFLIFIDSDEDGDMDSWDLIVGDEWSQLGYDKTTTWDQGFTDSH